MREKVESALNQVRSILQADGGDVELVDVTEDGVVKVRLIGACGHCPFAAFTLDGVVKVRLIGACGHCPFAAFTLKMQVEKMVKDKVPEVKSVEMA